jgi:signal transduction histidine kinase
VQFHLKDAVQESVDLLMPQASQKGLAVTVTIAPDVPPMLCGDPVRLGQLILNLAGNAVKFTPSGSVSIEVAMENRAHDQVTLHFEVRDTGIGIAPEKQRVIFDSFTQADGSMSRRFGGTGLGLAICSRLVEMMHGRIWVESALEKGSAFHFTALFGLPQLY